MEGQGCHGRAEFLEGSAQPWTTEEGRADPSASVEWRGRPEPREPLGWGKRCQGLDLDGNGREGQVPKEENLLLLLDYTVRT